MKVWTKLQRRRNQKKTRKTWILQHFRFVTNRMQTECGNFLIIMGNIFRFMIENWNPYQNSMDSKTVLRFLICTVAKNYQADWMIGQGWLESLRYISSCTADAFCKIGYCHFKGQISFQRITNSSQSLMIPRRLNNESVNVMVRVYVIKVYYIQYHFFRVKKFSSVLSSTRQLTWDPAIPTAKLIHI